QVPHQLAKVHPRFGREKEGQAIAVEGVLRIDEAHRQAPSRNALQREGVGDALQLPVGQQLVVVLPHGLPEHRANGRHHGAFRHHFHGGDHFAELNARRRLHQHPVAGHQLQLPGVEVVYLSGPLETDADDTHQLFDGLLLGSRLGHGNSPLYATTGRPHAAKSTNKTSTSERRPTLSARRRRNASTCSSAARTASGAMAAAQRSSSSFRSTFTSHVSGSRSASGRCCTSSTSRSQICKMSSISTSSSRRLCQLSAKRGAAVMSERRSSAKKSSAARRRCKSSSGESRVAASMLPSPRAPPSSAASP